MKIKMLRRKFNQGTGSLGSAVGILAFLLIVPLTILVLPENSGAKDWPTKPITLINPFSVGGSTDLVARILAPKMSEILGVSVQVVSKPGAGGITANLEVVKSPPDGYTLLMDSNSGSSIQYACLENLPYKLEERTYINRVTTNPGALIVPESSPWKTVEDLVNALRTNPSSITMAMVSGVTATDINVLQFRAALMAKGVDVSKTRIVSFPKGSGEVVVAQAGGHVDAGFSGIPTSSSLISAGKLRALAVTGAGRYKRWPNVPTMAEVGFPSVDCIYWIGLSGPPGLPANIAKIVDNTVREALSAPDVIDKLDRIGANLAYQPSDVHRKFVFDEAEAIKSIKLKLKR